MIGNQNNKFPEVYVSDKVIANLPMVKKLIVIFDCIKFVLLQTRCTKKQKETLNFALDRIQDLVDAERDAYLTYSFLLMFDKKEKGDNINGNNSDVDFE